MAARRQSSTTSLAQFARASSPDLANRPLDFCNAFWGQTDGGVDVLFARMRGATRTVDELKQFWKERASIEEEYAKKMSKLAKQSLGRDEIGELRNSLDTLRLETDKQASAHMLLAQQVRTELENTASAFAAKQAQYKRTYQAAIEKSYKSKQTQESYVTKAREKYELDCMKINSYTAQSSLVQGKDLEKIHLKLERAKQTVTANERDFANFSRALQDTVAKWEKDWTGFCDGCQDMEEERIEFMKDNMWTYANAVSTVCVSDDESCEKIRLSLEQLEPERDMENFVRDYGTGNVIADPPQYVSFSNQENNPPARPTPRHANFIRTSQRPLSMSAVMRPPRPEEEPIGPGSAGIGTFGLRGEPINGTEIDSHAGSHSPIVNGGTVHSPTPAPLNPPQATFTQGPQSSYHGVQDSRAEVNQPLHKTMLKVGENAYEVDLDKDPQQASRRAPGPSTAGSNGPKVGDEGDPLAKQMESLRSAAGTLRHAHKPSSSTTSQPAHAGPSSSTQPSSALTPPPASASQVKRDYRNSAELVVGGYPPSASRPSSPANHTSPPITAPFMQPPSPKPAAGSLPVEEVLAGYEQSFPGERRSLLIPGQSNSRGPSPSGQDANQNIKREGVPERPVSREGYAGIGARGQSPGLQGPGNRSSVVNPASPLNAPGASSSGQIANNVQRGVSPGNVGIALDPQGRVTHDSMAENFAKQRQVHSPMRQDSHDIPASAAALAAQHQEQNRYVGGPPAASPFPQPPVQPAYVPPPQMTAPPPPPPIQQPPPAPANYYNPHSPAHAHAHPPAHTQVPSHYSTHSQYSNYTQPPPPQQPVYHPNGAPPNGPSRGMSTSSEYYGYPSQNPYAVGQGAGAGYHPRSPSPAPPPVHVNPTPAASSSPTLQYTEDGRPVLFYVKALYDYRATIAEEFDFQSGDVIAVTSTPEDGWWTGELLDDKRRIPGRTIFPSNFVCLF